MDGGIAQAMSFEDPTSETHRQVGTVAPEVKDRAFVDLFEGGPLGWRVRSVGGQQAEQRFDCGVGRDQRQPRPRSRPTAEQGTRRRNQPRDAHSACEKVWIDIALIQACHRRIVRQMPPLSALVRLLARRCRSAPSGE